MNRQQWQRAAYRRVMQPGRKRAALMAALVDKEGKIPLIGGSARGDRMARVAPCGPWVPSHGYAGMGWRRRFWCRVTAIVRRLLSDERGGP